MSSLSLSSCELREAVRRQALAAGFDACGFARAEPVEAWAVEQYDRWIADGANDCMEYAARYRDVRNDPRLLLDGAKTIISVAMNYLPPVRQQAGSPQFALYAYGRDYHEVLKEQLFRLAAYIERETGCKSRSCVDTAPIRERYWARRAGLGFIGRNNMLIIPGRGSFFFLGELVTTLELEPDEPCSLSCAGCDRCAVACPGGALHDDGSAVDARRCLSCQLIERRGELPVWVARVVGNRVYGCDTCQLVCPHNAGAVPSPQPDFSPSAEFMSLTRRDIADMTPSRFRHIFSHSAVRRTRLDGLRRNASLLSVE